MYWPADGESRNVRMKNYKFKNVKGSYKSLSNPFTFLHSSFLDFSFQKNTASFILAKNGVPGVK